MEIKILKNLIRLNLAKHTTLIWVAPVLDNPSYRVARGGVPGTPYPLPGIVLYLALGVTVQFIPGTTW